MHVLSFSTGERSVARAKEEPHRELWELNPTSLVTAEFRQRSPIKIHLIPSLMSAHTHVRTQTTPPSNLNLNSRAFCFPLGPFQ